MPDIINNLSQATNNPVSDLASLNESPPNDRVVHEGKSYEMIVVDVENLQKKYKTLSIIETVCAAVSLPFVFLSMIVVISTGIPAAVVYIGAPVVLPLALLLGSIFLGPGGAGTAGGGILLASVLIGLVGIIAGGIIALPGLPFLAIAWLCSSKREQLFKQLEPSWYFTENSNPPMISSKLAENIDTMKKHTSKLTLKERQEAYEIAILVYGFDLDGVKEKYNNNFEAYKKDCFEAVRIVKQHKIIASFEMILKDPGAYKNYKQPLLLK